MKWLILICCAAACGGNGDDAAVADDGTRGFEPPVATNPESPVRYPPALYERMVEGTVVLRLYIEDDGTVVPDSTRIAESSGEPALDTAALAGVPAMTFAPARRDGRPVAIVFLQPVHFRHPDGVTAGGS